MEQSQQTGAVGGAMSGAAIGTQIMPGWGTAIGAVVGGIAGFLGGGGEKDAKKLAKAQANEILRAARENARIQTRMANQSVSLSKATTYASNIMDTGSQRKYRNALESQYRQAINYDLGAANMRAEIVKQGGQDAAQAIQRQGFGQLLSGATALGSAYAGGAFDVPKPAGARVTAGGYDLQPSLKIEDYQ